MFRDGRAAGIIEGRELGEVKGFEIGSEVGWYAGFCEVKTVADLLCTSRQNASRMLPRCSTCPMRTDCAGVEGIACTASSFVGKGRKAAGNNGADNQEISIE